MNQLRTIPKLDKFTSLQLIRQRTPRFEYAGTRAIYDLSGQGLPFQSLAFELIDKQWYIAE